MEGKGIVINQQGSQCPAMRLKMRGASGEVNEGAALCSV